MELEEFYTRIKPGLIRLSGCEIYVPDASAVRAGYRKIDGGRAVFVEKCDDTRGLAVVSREVVRVVKAGFTRWNVEAQAQAETEVA